MMKKSILLSLLIMMPNLHAFTGEELIQASQQTLAQAIFEVDQDSIEAFQVENGQHSMDAIVRAYDEVHGEDVDLEFGCHLHGTHVACHESGHTHLNKSFGFNDFYQGYLSSVKMLRESFQNTARSLDSLLLIKAWKGEHHHKAADEGEVWVKYEYTEQGQVKEIFTNCHRHEGEAFFSCHFQFAGEDEPTLEDDHGDDHDDDHGDDHDHDHDHDHNH